MTGVKRRSGKRPKAKKPPPNRHLLANRVAQVNEPVKVSSVPVSSSSKKLTEENASVDPTRKDWSGFRIIDIDKVFGQIAEFVCCNKCNNPIKISEVKRVGLSSLFEICCEKCGVLKVLRNCAVIKDSEDRTSELNKRLILASHVLGFKNTGTKTFCGLMDLPPPVSAKSYYKSLKELHAVLKEEAEENMVKSIEEESNLEGSNEIKGKVLDVEVLTTVCSGCTNYKGPKEGVEYTDWLESHKPNCTINHTGSSGAMEAIGVVRIFERSLQRGGVKFKTYIGDGDSKTYPALVKAKPYGDELIPEKAECVGHVQKRMGTRLRTLKKSYSGKKLADGKSIGGRGRLTDQWIDKLSSFYGMAIRSSSDVKTMKNKIWAIWHHYNSTDKKPTHHLCPKGENSWCNYNKAKSKGTLPKFKHKAALPGAVLTAIKPVFKDLSKEELLQKCVGGYTQNPNESLNNLIWKNVPKTVFCGRKTLEIGVHDAVIVFNSGQKGRLKVFEKLGITPGQFCVSYCNEKDTLRKTVAQKRVLETTKEARKAKRQKNKDTSEKQLAEEGVMYAPGAF
ncbi:uncharacterized protein LOC113205481 isoform X2 [Frankliniella occidentalis]|uniref:Uncharacterized protein LOC113205481 isoform X2 n=1 Tax=Frankliniella occidentalis TaxID=133901 RepID=A0A9C6X378_FRAOC|nr:uncharacterized protein LOC113205481 isoform X2 [Frankliniella occidentalis]